MPSTEFTTAYSEASKLKQKPSQDEQLKLYGLAKIAQGETVKQPGSFDFAGKYKYNAWKKLTDEGVTAEQADKQYVELVTSFKEKYGFSG